MNERDAVVGNTVRKPRRRRIQSTSHRTDSSLRPNTKVAVSEGFNKIVSKSARAISLVANS